MSYYSTNSLFVFSVPLPGKSLSLDGKLELPPEFLTPGLSWQSDTLQLFDDGLLIERDKNGTVIRQSKGLVAFGTIDDRNVFHLQPPLRNGKLIDWEILRNASVAREGKSDKPQVLPFDDTPVFVPTEIIDQLYEKVIDYQGSTLVQIAAPKMGPPIIIPIGALLNDGNVLLNDGIEVQGIRWESEDRILYPNGTIHYKLVNRKEMAKIAYGTIDQQGQIKLLPRLGKHKTSLSLLNELNVKPRSRKIQTKVNGLADNELFRIRERMLRTKREVEDENYQELVTNLKFVLSLVATLHEMDSANAEYWTEHSLCDAFNTIGSNSLLPLIEKTYHRYNCFAQNVLDYCAKPYSI